jgi:alcohol dehydrogenase class IV
VSDAAALEAASLISDGLGSEEPDRPRLALGALLAGYALGTTGLAVHHIVSQSVVRITGTPHAQTNAVILPHALQLMTARAPGALGRLALAFGADTADPGRAVAQAAVLCARAEVTKLVDLGVEWQQLDEVVQAALERPELRNTPEPPGARELKELLENAYE